jgi:FkbM family methyltransferase
MYYALFHPANGLFVIRIGETECGFCARDPVELRIVELSLESERTILELVLSEIRNGDCFLDVGANFGIFSIFAAASGAQVVACEPEPRALQRLLANQETNKLTFQILKKALSSEKGTVYFTVPDSDQIIQNSGIAEHGTLIVERITGDSLQIHPNIVKIDVEGHEIHVLRGLKKSFDRCRLCVVELHQGVDSSSVAKELRSCGFSSIESGHGKLIARAQPQLDRVPVEQA